MPKRKDSYFDGSEKFSQDCADVERFSNARRNFLIAYVALIATAVGGYFILPHVTKKCKSLIQEALKPAVKEQTVIPRKPVGLLKVGKLPSNRLG